MKKKMAVVAIVSLEIGVAIESGILVSIGSIILGFLVILTYAGGLRNEDY